MKLFVQEEENNNYISEINDLKEEKKNLYREKEDIKIDCSQLVDKN